MDEFKNRMNILNVEKQKIVDYVLNNFNNEDSVVVDLGAGECVIEKALQASNFKGTILACDKNKCDSYSGCKICDIGLFMTSNYTRINKFKHCCIILSAVMHELSANELTIVSEVIANLKNCTLLIREPINEFRGKTYRNYKFKKTYREKWNEYKKIHYKKWETNTLFINFCFAISYGENAWEREKNEGRFTFSFLDMLAFFKACDISSYDINLENNIFYETSLPKGLYKYLCGQGVGTGCLWIGKKN